MVVSHLLALSLLKGQVPAFGISGARRMCLFCLVSMMLYCVSTRYRVMLTRHEENMA